jgi:uncharacterized protein YbcV (DUF1398 family)
MNIHVKSIVGACSRGSEDGSLDFGQVLLRLADAGVESYFADLRSSTKTYYLPDGDSIDILCTAWKVPVAPNFDASMVEAAVQQSQAGKHTYADFCKKVMAGGCCGSLVSLLGRRVVSFGRAGETHVEYFPPAN